MSDEANRDEESLDPKDWNEFEAQARRILEDSLRYMRTIRDRPAWQNMPEPVRASFKTPVPAQPTPLGKVYDEVLQNVMPYPMGNIHPRFWAWVVGSSNFTGVLAEFIASVQGSNLGGGNHAAVEMELQVVNWCKEIVGYPPSSSGTLVSGGSVANLICLAVARKATSGIDIRLEGMAGLKQPLKVYSSDQVHFSINKSMETLGLGRKSLAIIPSDADFRIDVAALERQIKADRASGIKPAVVVGYVGTTNTGAIDDLPALVALCKREGLWLHLDACIGAVIAIAPKHKGLVEGLGEADSIAWDAHKWLHAPFEAGVVMIKNAKDHKETFSDHEEWTTDYVDEKPRGIAAGPYLHELGLQTSRSFRALKLWMMIKEHGLAKFGRLIDQNIDQAHYLTKVIEQNPKLELMAKTLINIVCFRYTRPGLADDKLKEINTEIMMRLQETGVAVMTDTEIHGKHCLRVAISNHRTRRSDLDLVMKEVCKIGDSLS